MKENQKLYDTEEIAKEYRGKVFLSPPERTILKIAVPSGKGARMLDIGVGTGRTTPFFAPFFDSYFGIDYSESMIKACKTAYINMPNLQFALADARNMKMFTDHSFDYVLFSFNGIDCVNQADRIQILSEIKRVLKTGGRFAFSSHNIHHVNKLFSYQIPRNPLKYFAEYTRRNKVRKLNPPAEEILTCDITELVDGDINFRARYVYIKPEFQIKQLLNIGFSDIRIFSLTTGKELHAQTSWSEINDAWLYYLCTV